MSFTANKNNWISLMNDYDLIKPIVIRFMMKHNTDEQVIFDYHLESIYFSKHVIDNMIRKKMDKNEILKCIDTINDYYYITQAKCYFRNYNGSIHIWDELRFLSKEYTSEEYYNYCNDNLKSLTIKEKILSVIRR